MTPNDEGYIARHREVVRGIFRRKEEFHRAQAKLPIEEKIRLLVELQKIALSIRPVQSTDDRRMVWRLT